MSTEAPDAAALYFDPAKMSSIVGAMRELQRDEKLRRQLSEKGLALAKGFRADRVVRKLLGAYARAARGIIAQGPTGDSPGGNPLENPENRG